MKLLVLFIIAVHGLQYLSAVIHSQEVASLPPLQSLWHPNLYLARDFAGLHYEVRHAAKPYDVSLSYLQESQKATAPSNHMDCRCRFETQGQALGAGSFLQKTAGNQAPPILQIEGIGKSKGLTYEIPLSPRVDTDPNPPQIHLEKTLSDAGPVVTRKELMNIQSGAPETPQQANIVQQLLMKSPALEQTGGSVQRSQPLAAAPLPQAAPQPVPTLMQPGPPSQIFQQLPLGFTQPESNGSTMMFVPMMMPQNPFLFPQNFYQTPAQSFFPQQAVAYSPQLSGDLSQFQQAQTTQVPPSSFQPMAYPPAGFQSVQPSSVQYVPPGFLSNRY